MRLVHPARQGGFSHDAFRKGVEGKFVLVEIDSPRDKTKLSEETQKQNAELVKT